MTTPANRKARRAHERKQNKIRANAQAGRYSQLVQQGNAELVAENVTVVADPADKKLTGESAASAAWIEES